MSPTNKAAYLIADKAPLEVRSAPYTPPSPNELVIRTSAVAINPVDWVKQETGNMIMSWIKLPHIIGTDIAGTITAAGSAIPPSKFKPGDRVLTHAASMDKQHNTPTKGAFQNYVVALPHMTAKIPDSISFEAASVIPLGLSTAACGLFQKDQLGLQHPTSPPAPAVDKTVLIWGGSTSVGCNAIQLAVAAGYDVITTCSPRNFALMRSLGAEHVFDYRSKTVAADIIATLQKRGRSLAGALSMGYNSAPCCLTILHACAGDKKLAMATFPLPEEKPTRFVLPRTAYAYVSGMLAIWVKGKLWGVRWRPIWGSSLMHNEVGPAVYEGFLGRALLAGEFVPSPEAMVVEGRGVEGVQGALEVQKRGVSARKVVVAF